MKGEEEDEIRKLVSYHTLDTSGFSDILVQQVINHPDFDTESKKGLVKLWVRLRKVWHDDDIMPAIMMQGNHINENTTRVDGKFYLADILRKQPNASVMYTIDEGGNVTLDRTLFLVFCLSIGRQLSTFKLLRPEEEEEIMGMLQTLSSGFDSKKACD